MKTIESRISELKSKISRNNNVICSWVERILEGCDKKDENWGKDVIADCEQENVTLKAEMKTYEGMDPTMHPEQVVKKYCNKQYPRDTYPYEVVRVVSDTCVEVREMLTGPNKTKMNFVPGGFAAHCTNVREQDYDYTSNPEGEVFKVRFSKAKGQWQYKGTTFWMSDKPVFFRDFND